ncbi:MATE family efflux transporter [Parvularcula lutaonensis]|uniref:MATE family efflux transporter n=1 Tax=Parvularcula lutaonensis TaxID=491923 RepID=A0ABV7M9L8_9PROT|nr:MATE family efflux transporter [Parvularcula lutaonensis]GGY45682.1 MATE family efflux transporter [Parvularcula lutaonensis]
MANRDLTEGPVAGHLARLGLPMVIGVAAVLSVSLADTFFLGKLGTEELAAISFTFPVVLTITSLGIGMSAGASSVASRAIGRGDMDRTRRLATDAMILSFIIVALVSVAGWFLARPLFSLLGAQGGVLDMVVAYMRVWFVGVPFLVVPMVAMGLIRANGDSTVPSLIMVAGALINIALDPAFIFGWGPIPPLGVEGAAWATLAARAIMLVAAMFVVIHREKLLTAAVPTATAFAHSAWEVLKVGIPAAGSNMINPLSIGIVTAFLATYGNEAVAAFGVATRVEALTTIPMLALSSAIGPVAGQNWGSGKPDRTKAAIGNAFLFVVLCGFVLGASFFLLADPIVGLFTDDSAVRNIATSYLLIVGVTLGGYGVVINASAAFNAIGKAWVGLLFTFLRSFILYIPAAWIATQFGPPWAVFFGIALTNIVAGLSVAILAFVALGKVRA